MGRHEDEDEEEVRPEGETAREPKVSGEKVQNEKCI